MSMAVRNALFGSGVASICSETTAPLGSGECIASENPGVGDDHDIMES